MLLKMGRPKEHDQRTADALLEAAERRVAAGGLEALSVRGVAEDVGTTTRAVYSVFGSKEGMLVALGSQAWRMLGAAVAELPTTADPAADLVEAGVVAFRRFAVGHPILFSVGVQRTLASPELASRFDAARLAALTGLEAKLTRLKSTRLLGRRTLRDMACEFHALCEGLAAMELRGAMTRGEEERIWRDGLTALVAGLAVAH
jgi:AcrR family transcriptional regulator